MSEFLEESHKTGFTDGLQNNQSFTPTAWRKVIVNTEKDAEASLKQIEAKANAIIEEFNNTFASEISNKVSFEH